MHSRSPAKRRAARDGKPLIWAPAFFRPMMWVLKQLPAPIFRRLPI